MPRGVAASIGYSVEPDAADSSRRAQNRLTVCAQAIDVKLDSFVDECFDFFADSPTATPPGDRARRLHP